MAILFCFRSGVETLSRELAFPINRGSSCPVDLLLATRRHFHQLSELLMQRMMLWLTDIDSFGDRVDSVLGHLQFGFHLQSQGILGAESVQRGDTNESHP